MKNKFAFCTILAFLFCTFSAFSQVEKVIYQSVNIPDSTEQFHFDIADPHEIISWQGNQIMIETTARFDGGTTELLKILIQEGRYVLKIDNKFPLTVVQPAIFPRSSVKRNSVVCNETIFYRIYVPEEFLKKGEDDFAKNIEPITASRN